MLISSDGETELCQCDPHFTFWFHTFQSILFSSTNQTKKTCMLSLSYQVFLHKKIKYKTTFKNDKKSGFFLKSGIKNNENILDPFISEPIHFTKNIGIIV